MGEGQLVTSMLSYFAYTISLSHTFPYLSIPGGTEEGPPIIVDEVYKVA